ncbi:MAG: DUF4239 domain-containing protein [Desulfomonilaceae bacterium]
MNFATNILLFAIGLFFGMLFFLEVGRRVGIRRRVIDPTGASTGVGALDGAVFALLGLLIAFTFSGAASRFDTRRQLIVEESNSIGTAYLRLDLLKEQARERLRQDFKLYVKTRMEVYRKLPDIEGAKQEWDKAAAIQGEIWNQAVSACQEGGSQSATMLLLPALNQMIDITATRKMATEIHPPFIIFAMLCILALISALIAGDGMTSKKTQSWIHIIGFAAITAATIYVILDLEYPRLGLIRVDAADKTLLELMQSMK